MFPIALCVEELPLILVGNGAKTVKRLAQLRRAGAVHVRVYADDPSDDLIDAAGDALVTRLPEREELRKASVVMVVDLPVEVAAEIATVAREEGTLVNVEDVKPYCDFYFMAEVRRGDLILAVSTSGKSPATAVEVRKQLEGQYGEEWGDSSQWPVAGGQKVEKA